MVECHDSPESVKPSGQAAVATLGAPAGGISVIIPAYNAQAVIGRAIESVLAQTLSPQEIIVVDDGSTDGTCQAIKDFGGHVQYIHQTNAGASAARNAGILAASGEWIAFLDADDEWLPHRLARQVQLLAEYPFLNWVTGNFSRCRCRQHHKSSPDLDTRQQQKILHSLQGRPIFDSYFSAHRQRAMGHTDTMLIRREILLKAGLFEVGRKRINDVDLWLRIAYLREPIGYVFEPLAIYHLDTKGSILKAHRTADHIDTFLKRHFVLAEQAGMLETFRPTARAMLGWWLGRRLEEGDGKQVRFLLGKYRNLFSDSSYRKLYVSSFCPRTAALYNRLKEHLLKAWENLAG